MALLASEYLAYHQGRPVFQLSEIRIQIGHGALDVFSQFQQDQPELLMADGQIDRMYSVLSLLRNGPPSSAFGMNVPKWSHFSEGD